MTNAINIIKVRGFDIQYKSVKCEMYINPQHIISIYPNYVTIDPEGGVWKSHPKDRKGIISGYLLTCSDGKTYECSDDEELSKLNLGTYKGSVKH